MNILKKLFGRKDPHAKAAQALYELVIQRTRSPVFYESYGVPDEFDARYDLAMIHGILLMLRLKEMNSEDASALSQSFFDTFFQGIDQALRQVGVSDVRIGAKVKKMVQALYGRTSAYEEALAAQDPEPMKSALDRNLYQDVPSATDDLDIWLTAMADYVHASHAALKASDYEAFVSGEVAFAPLPEAPK